MVLAGGWLGRAEVACEEAKMELLLRTWVRVRELEGQSMTEYALILAAIAVAAFSTYAALGNRLVNLVSTVTTNL